MNIGMKKFSSLDLCGQGDKIVVSKSINETRAEKKWICELEIQSHRAKIFATCGFYGNDHDEVEYCHLILALNVTYVIDCRWTCEWLIIVDTF